MLKNILCVEYQCLGGLCWNLNIFQVFGSVHGAEQCCLDQHRELNKVFMVNGLEGWREREKAKIIGLQICPSSSSANQSTTSHQLPNSDVSSALFLSPTLPVWHIPHAFLYAHFSNAFPSLLLTRMQEPGSYVLGGTLHSI